jgi:hypothetical protein
MYSAAYYTTCQEESAPVSKKLGFSCSSATVFLLLPLDLRMPAPLSSRPLHKFFAIAKILLAFPAKPR